MFNPEVPYDIPPLPVDGIETVKILKKVTPAARALSALNQVARLLTNQNLLVNLIPILESKSSSEIENIVTTTDALFKHESDSSTADPATKEALRYKKALFLGFESVSGDNARPLNTNTAVDICSELIDKQVDVRKVIGTNLKNQRTGEVIYTPPVGEDNLRNKLSNWESYIHDHDVDPLIALAVAHYQFEAIHPFLDGNGRTGRILNILFLIENELLSQPILYLSRYIMENKEDYYRLLLNVTQEGDWEPWICFMLEAITITSQWTINKVNAIVELQKQTSEYIKASSQKNYSYELVELLFEKPYLRTRDLIDRGLYRSRQAAIGALKSLEELGVLESKTAGRETLFINTRLLDLMSYDTNEFLPFEYGPKE
ncbi:Fic family protein [Vibrio litoralis]|uniref:Fic family protein n=1 Tax=Vibrio litoralis TaxID=335972 RepID=UPI000406CC9D|nr:Fic family protein [Vibrio litoralis]